MRTAFKHQWLDWSHCYLSATVAAACGIGQMVSLPENVRHKTFCRYSLSVLLIELMTRRQTRFPPPIPTHTIFRFNQSQDCCFYRCLTPSCVPKSFKRCHGLCLAVCWKLCRVGLGPLQEGAALSLQKSLSSPGRHCKCWRWSVAMSHGGYNTSTHSSTILPIHLHIGENQEEKVNVICLWAFSSEAIVAFNFCQPALVFYGKSRSAYLKSEKVNSATGNNAMT